MTPTAPRMRRPEHEEDPNEALPRWERPSRSARKREAEGRQRLGMRLVGLTAVQLASLTLPESLLEAVREAQRLRSRPALARQHQFIGRLMRDIDPEPIEQALAKMQR